ncbi:hypothetical protein M3Y99_00130600 [Aphelenchoides fujianensis]|nr:hypothetical protein M3Y99_00130600 [Aphelenchoides fujianensis]
MEWFLVDRARFEERYNCSFYDPQTIPRAARQHRLLGVLIIACYFVFVGAYLPCLYAMLSGEHRRKASYRLMFLLGLIHVLDLQFCGLLTGVLAIMGAVYCEHPTLIFVSGAIAVACWCASTMTSMILGLNRCCELYSGRLAAAVFGGWRMGVWCALPVGWFVFIAGWTPPGIFYGVQLACPHIGYFEDAAGRYTNLPHTANNFVVCSTEFLVYATLIGLYVRMTRGQGAVAKSAAGRERKQPEVLSQLSCASAERAERGESRPIRPNREHTVPNKRRELDANSGLKLKKHPALQPFVQPSTVQIYVQIILVGTIHFVAGFTYVLMQFFDVDFYATLVASTFYLLSQGAPPLIYLTLNRSIRNVLRARLGLRKEAAGASRATPGRSVAPLPAGRTHPPEVSTVSRISSGV